MAERPCELGDFKGVGQFEAKFWAERLRFAPGEWLYYKYAAGTFHTKKLCSKLYLTETEFYSKNENVTFSPTIWGT